MTELKPCPIEDKLNARIAELERALAPFAFISFEDCQTTQQVWEIVYQDRLKDWIDFDSIDAARKALKGGE